MKYNPELKSWRQPIPSGKAGKGFIEKPGDMKYNFAYQNREGELTEYEINLTSALERVFLAGAQKLNEIVSGLNDQGVLLPGGQQWTEETFVHEIKRLVR
ncbi:MAG: hypothetical protein COB36_11345 [Alphaproteobacteria bacterium]|nr:MAG: hypothetical protein COB36_11345 [Alphaproteobacteria bacterium]